MNNIRYFRILIEVGKMKLRLANGTVIHALHKGMIGVELQPAMLEMTKVFYVPPLQLNVIYCSRMDEQDITVIIGNFKYQSFDRQERNNVLGTLWPDSTDRVS